MIKQEKYYYKQARKHNLYFTLSTIILSIFIYIPNSHLFPHSCSLIITSPLLYQTTTTTVFVLSVG